MPKVQDEAQKKTVGGHLTTTLIHYVYRRPRFSPEFKERLEITSNRYEAACGVAVYSAKRKYGTRFTMRSERITCEACKHKVVYAKMLEDV